MRKCRYSVGFQDIPADLSQEGTASDTSGEGYSNRVAEAADGEVQDITGYNSELEDVDRIDDEGLISAIGDISGTEASSAVEGLVGYVHPAHIGNDIRRVDDTPAISIKFKVGQEAEQQECVDDDVTESVGNKEEAEGAELVNEEQSCSDISLD